MTYPPQPGGPQWGPPPQPYQPYQAYPPGYGPPMPPPKKRRTALWIVLGCVVFVLAAGVGVTGFVAPGFFLDRDHPIGEPSTMNAQTLMFQFTNKLNAHDGNAAAQFGCESGDDEMFANIRTKLITPDRTGYHTLKIEGPGSNNTAFADVQYTYGESEPHNGSFSAILRKGPDGGFCIFGIIGA